MLLISGYHFEEEINYIRNYRIKQQEFAQQQLIIKEKQKNLLMTFNLLAEKEAARNKPAASLTSHLQQMREYYQKEFRKQAKFFSCQYTVEEETNVLNDETLYLLIQLFEKFLSDPSFGTIDILIKQEQNQLIIEIKKSSNTLRSH